MTIYSIDNPLSDDGRNKINNNFEELKKSNNNTQVQVNKLVVKGDSSPQAIQASIGADGTDYDGNLKARLDAEFNRTTAELATIDQQKADKIELEQQKSRIDNILVLPDGSTTNDARLEDIKIGYDGEVYESPGEAVRKQFTDIKNNAEVESERNDSFFKTYDKSLDFYRGGLKDGAEPLDNVTNRARSMFIPLKKGDKIVSINGYEMNVHFYNSDESFIENTVNTTGKWLTSHILNKDSLVRLIVRKYDDSDISTRWEASKNVVIISNNYNSIFNYYNNIAFNSDNRVNNRAVTTVFIDKDTVIRANEDYEFYVVGFDMNGYLIYNTYETYGSAFIKEYYIDNIGTFATIVVRKKDDSDCTDLQNVNNNILISKMGDKWVAPTFKNGYLIDRATGQTEIHDTYRLNDCFYELNGDMLNIEADNYFTIFFYDENYELINNTKIEPDLIIRTRYRHFPDMVFNNAKYIRLETNIEDINVLIKNGVYENKHDMNVYVSTDSTDEFAEFIVTKTNGTEALQQALWLSYLRGGKVILAEGDYYLNKLSNHQDNGNLHCLYVLHHTAPQQFNNKARMFTMEGAIASLGYENGVRIIMSQELFDSLGVDEEVSLIRSEYQGGYDVFTEGVSAIAMKNITVILPFNDKPISAIDLSYTHACDFDNVKTMAFYPEYTFDSYNPPPIAHEKCYGIIGLMGSNWNTLNTFRNIESIGYHIGFDISGEHCSVINASVKFNYYGFTFGVLQKYGAYHHPITCINLLDEHSVCMPLFSQGGSENRQMINIFGYNLMFPSWSSQGDITADDERHRNAVELGNLENGWGGVIYYTNNTKIGTGEISGNQQNPAFFEKGGKNIKCVNGAAYLAAFTEYRNQLQPNYLQQVYDKTLQKLLIWDGTKWVDTNGNVVD